ncbi:MAG: Gfo/Idh/MocA family oxidoreductase [Caldilineaceae bacterium]|nr:Gfo/Idh/MocA family oxidoreductase [Caldilineaceae bacterium]
MPALPNQSIHRPIRLALIGAGIYARDAHLPSLLRHPDIFEIAAIYSRTKTTAQSLAEQIPHPVDLYTDLGALLARPDIEAVEILLPIPALPAAIRQTLAAGKHLLSEKPIAPDVATGRELLTQHAHHPEIIWMVGENWRYEDAYLQAAEIVRSGLIGTPLTCHWAIYTPITAKSKYYHTLWRRDSSSPGGFLMDGGIHHLAALRLILGEITQVSATTRQNSPDLPPADTLAATLTFANGVIGTYLATYAIAAPWPPQLYIGGTQGSLRLQRKEIELTREGKTERIETAGFDGVEKELLAFASSIRSHTPHRNLPAAALRDLAVVEAMLDSAASGRPVTPEKVEAV